jgi:hypothetical protein
MSDLKTARPHWFHPETGELLSSSERAKADLLIRNAQRNAEQQVAAMQPSKPLTHNEKLLAATQQRIEELQTKLKFCLPTDRDGIQRRLGMFKAEAAKLEGEMKAEAKQQAFANSPDVARARENAEALSRSWRETYPHADESAVLLAVEIARSEQWESPEALRQAFWRQVEIITEQNLASERRNATLATESRLQAEAAEARAKVAQLEAEQRLNDVRGQQ